MNKQALIYSLKVWLTSLATLIVSIEAMIFYALAQPNHSREWLDPYYGAFVSFILALMFLPTAIVFAFTVRRVRERFKTSFKVKTVLSVITGALIAITVVPLTASIYPDFTYLWIGSLYLACMLIGIWIYKLTPVANEVPITTDKE